MRGHDPHAVKDADADARQQDRRRSDHPMMRAGKAENAVATAGMALSIGRRRRALRIVDAKLEGRRAISVSDRLEAADRDQQALRGNGISDDDTDQRSPKSPGIGARSEHAVPRNARS